VSPLVDPAAPADAAALTREDFAVVIPAYDEAENVPALFAALRATFDRHALDGEIVLVDDGSTDDTAALARCEGARSRARVRVLRHPRNRGKTEAILTGAGATTARHLVIFDADLQYDPDDIPRLLDKLAEGWDIVAATKVGAYEKRYVSLAYNWLSRRLFVIPVRDLNSMKALRRAVLDAVPLRHDWHRFLVALAVAQGFSVAELEVALRPRRAGASKYAGTGRVVVGALDLIVVWFYLRFSARPMQLFGGLGLVLGTLGAVVGGATVLLRAAHVPPPPFGYRPLLQLVALLVTVGIALLGFGLLAEMTAILRGELLQARRLGRGRVPEP
jgi:glycosyltransferase involved in cell wall biosynthesis